MMWIQMDLNRQLPILNNPFDLDTIVNKGLHEVFHFEFLFFRFLIQC